MACGVTFARDPGNDNDSLLRLEDRVNAGEFLGPRLRKSGFLEGKSPFNAHGGFTVDNLEEAKQKVRWYASHGFWGIKIYNSMNPDFVKPIAAEAHRLGLHVSGHVPAFMSSERAVRDGYDEINHLNQLMLSFIIDPLKDDTRTPFRFTALGERMAKLPLESELDVKPEMYPTYEASWKRLEETLLMLYKAGITLVPGTDDQPGYMLHSELEVWVKAGIPAAEVLKAATLGGAKFLGMDRELGSIAPGKLADLYLVDGDPVADIANIRKAKLTVKGGNYYFPDEIETALDVKPFAAHAAVR